MVISFENVTYIKNIKTKEETKVLDNVSFHIEESTITSILGDSKSGIEYLSLLINKSITPTYGRVKTLNFINERKRINNINRLKSKVGLILTNPKDMLFNKTVKEELAFSLKHFKYKNNENRL